MHPPYCLWLLQMIPRRRINILFPEKYKKYKTLTKAGKAGKKLLFTQAFVFLDFHQDNVLTDLADTFPGDHIFTFMAEKSAESAGTGNYKCSKPTGAAVKFNICSTAKAFTGTGVDDFLSL